jgi:hypothetical protein
VREVIKLGESLLDAAAPAESYSIGETEQNIRGGGYEVVGVAQRAVGGARVGQAPSAEAASVMVSPRPTRWMLTHPGCGMPSPCPDIVPSRNRVFKHPWRSLSR